MAFTETKLFETIMGDRIFGCYRLTGDGSDTTWAVPVGVLDGAWVSHYFATGVAGTSAQITFTGHTVTFNEAPASSQLVDVFYIGV